MSEVPHTLGTMTKTYLDVTGPYDFPDQIPPLEEFRQAALDIADGLIAEISDEPAAESR